jgi:hypothetical protein
MLDKFIDFWSSLRLTVVCLFAGLVLVFAGTIAQVDLGLYKAQNDFFRSFFVFWSPPGTGLKIPVFPGGYLVGGFLLINLISAHYKRFGFRRDKAGIVMVHLGLILLLIGQLATDMLSKESSMQLFEGESKNYSEDFRGNELVILDQSDSEYDRVHAIPEYSLEKNKTISDPKLPFDVTLKKRWVNASLVQADSKAPQNAIKSGATEGLLKDALVVPAPSVTDMDGRNTPTALVELSKAGRTLGTFLVSSYTGADQPFTVDGKQFNIAMRFARHYYPFTLTLLKATHEKYKGTEIPKNFASRVKVRNSEKNEDRETVIYMNNPLRYSGSTFYQYQMSAGEMASSMGSAPSSTFQVVRNPGWLTPYFSTILISIGLLFQFGLHLVGFIKKRYV